MAVQGASAPAAAARIAPVAVPKPAEVFADILRQKIFDGEFATGEALPAERVLVEQSQLSRSTVREALAILKQQGLIVTKSGRNGGSIVTRPTQSDLIASLDVYLLSKGLGPQTPTLTETRQVIEPWCAALAASRATGDDLEAIEAAHRHMVSLIDDTARYIRASQDWHFAVADASHNSLLAALMRVRADAVRAAASAGRYAERAAREESIEFHAQITERILARDPRGAYAAMGTHLRAAVPGLMDHLVAEVAALRVDDAPTR